MPDATPTIRCAVLTVSDTRTLDTDTSGAAVVDRLSAAAHDVVARKIVRDEIEDIRQQLRAWIDGESIDVVVVTGGTGVTTRDITPEALEPLVTKRIPGFGELFRWLSFAAIGTSTIQSRAEAAICQGTLVFLLPGSTGAVRLAMEQIIVPQLDVTQKPCNFAELLPRIRPR